MSGKLDKSLDEIISTQRRTSVRGRSTRRTRRPGATKPAAVAPVGGIKKNPRQVKGAAKAVPTGPSGGNSEGRILVSGFVSCLISYYLEHLLTFLQPKDITEAMIKVCNR